MILKENKII